MKVPRLKQRPNSCGTTSLRMVMAFWGKDVSEKEVIQGVGGLKSYGVKTTKLAEYARDLGFNTYCLSYNKKLADSRVKIKMPDTEDILIYLRKKVPVIVNVRHSLIYKRPLTRVGHFVVLTGYKKGVFQYNDPRDGKSHHIKEGHFKFAWFNNALDSSGYLLVIYPKTTRKTRT